MSEKETEQLTAFIAEEARKARKATTSTYIFGLIAACIIGAYMGFILHMEKTFLQPDNLAYLMRLEAEAALPGIIRDTENAIVESAANGTQRLSDEFISLVPRMTAAGMEQIDLTYTEQIPFISTELSAIVEEYIHLHGPELASFANEHTSQEFATYFTEEMMAEFHRQLDQQLKDSYEGRDLAYFKENLTDSIIAMNQTVDELVAQHPDTMDRRTRLQRRLLARLVAMATATPETDQ